MSIPKVSSILHQPLTREQLCCDGLVSERPITLWALDLAPEYVSLSEQLANEQYQFGTDRDASEKGAACVRTVSTYWLRRMVTVHSGAHDTLFTLPHGSIIEIEHNTAFTLGQVTANATVRVTTPYNTQFAGTFPEHPMFPLDATNTIATGLAGHLSRVDSRVAA